MIPRVHHVLDRRAGRRDGKAVEREPKQLPLMLHHADDAVRLTADPHLLPDRVAIGEQLQGDFLAEHDDGTPNGIPAT